MFPDLYLAAENIVIAQAVQALVKTKTDAVKVGTGQHLFVLLE